MDNGIEMKRQAQHITALREEAKLTQKAFALMFSELTHSDDITVGTVLDWEMGKTSPASSVVDTMSMLFWVAPDFIRGKTTDRTLTPEEAERLRAKFGDIPHVI